jgi:hypothetical protein
MVRSYLRHLKDCSVARHLLRTHPSENLRQLYWYDLRLADAVTVGGILKVFLWALRKRQQDEIAGNYNLVNLYYAPPPGDGLKEPAPTVWFCRSLPTKPWYDEPSPIRTALEERGKTIIAEFEAVAHRIGTHPDNTSLTGKGKWSGMFLYQAKGIKNEELCRLCPTTTAVVESFPLCKNFGFVMFSGVDPNTHIKPHTGSSNLRLRHHLGIRIPEPDKARIRVGTEWRHWGQGETLAFDDSFEHEVVHEGKQERVALVLDVWHPSLSKQDIAVLSHPVFQRFGKAATESGQRAANRA